MRSISALLLAAAFLAGVSGCVTVPMRYDGYVGGYVPAASVSYHSTPYYYYGGVPYYYSSGRFMYYSGGRRLYVNTLPWGGYYNYRHPVYPYRTYGGRVRSGWSVSGSWGVRGGWR